MASDELIIKKESDDVDLSLNNLKTLYSVKEKYRRRQKNSAGNYIPFESIDKSIYHCRQRAPIENVWSTSGIF